LTQLIDANDDQVVSVARHYGRGKGSGVEVETVFANMATFRDGKAIRWEMLQSPRRGSRSRGASKVDEPREAPPGRQPPGRRAVIPPLGVSRAGAIRTLLV
jgi:hypothetical protein